ncbi:MAG: hypothetical protein IKQ59_04060 [Prevotella sp.]|nr:hypothetical protein [Prevotella sp.]
MGTGTLTRVWVKCLSPRPVQAQIKECEVLSLTDAIVIGEYLPCTPRDSVYVEGNHYICFDGKKVPFVTYASFNKSLIKRLESNISIPECLKNIEWDPIVDYLDYNYTYYLKFSKHERQNQEVRGQLIESEDIYKRRGKKKLYVVYSMEGEIVLYKTRRKTKLFTGFKDPFFTKKPLILSKFAVLKKAEKLRSLTIEEIRSMNLKKYEGSYIKLFIPE